MSRSQIFGIPLPEGSSLPDAVFFGCGVLIGGLGGILQSASRSLMVRHTDPARDDRELWPLWPVGSRHRLSGPGADRRWRYKLATGSARLGITPVIGLFLIGLILLFWVQGEGDQG